MAETERRNSEKTLRDGQRELARKQNEFLEDLNVRRNEALGQLQRTVLQEVQTYAKSAGLDVVVADALYASPSVDITAQVLTALQSQGPHGPRRRSPDPAPEPGEAARRQSCRCGLGELAVRFGCELQRRPRRGGRPRRHAAGRRSRRARVPRQHHAIAGTSPRPARRPSCSMPASAAHCPVHRADRRQSLRDLRAHRAGACIRSRRFDARPPSERRRRGRRRHRSDRLDRRRLLTSDAGARIGAAGVRRAGLGRARATPRIGAGHAAASPASRFATTSRIGERCLLQPAS